MQGRTECSPPMCLVPPRRVSTRGQGRWPRSRGDRSRRAAGAGAGERTQGGERPENAGARAVEAASGFSLDLFGDDDLKTTFSKPNL